MQATYCALCKHGYAEVTMQDIADESDRSKAALHYHFDTKEGLLLAFLEYLFESFEARVSIPDDRCDGAVERLVAFVDAVLAPACDGETQEFRTAVLEIKAQSPYDEAYRERLVEFDDLIHDRVRGIVADGIDEGAFRDDVDPDDVAEFVVTAINGAQTRRVATGHPIASTRRMLVEYVEKRLLAEDVEVDVGDGGAAGDGCADGTDADDAANGGVVVE